MSEFVTYAWDRLALVLLFASGYLAYRLLAVSGLTDFAVRLAVRRSRGEPSRVVLYVIAATALLSAFIPNAIAVLAVLPVITALDRQHCLAHPGAPLSTALALAAMYGANIGGMASLIGSPANLILLGLLDLYRVPGREQITFLNWFLWGVPLAAALAGLGWLLIARLALPRRALGCKLDLGPDSALPGLDPRQRLGLRLYVLFLVFWIGEAVLAGLWPGVKAWEPLAALAFFAWFCRQCFRSRPGEAPGPLLPVRAVFADVPGRSLFWLAVLAAVMLAANALGLDRSLAALFQGLTGRLDSQLLLTLFFVLAAVFLTEILSNTVVAVVLFPLALFTAQAAGLDPLPVLVGSAVAATCAFMTPIATMPNALAFGALPGVSLRRMLLLGLVMNVCGALIMTGWLSCIVPLLYE